MQTIRINFINHNGKPCSVDLTERAARQTIESLRETIADIEAQLAELAHPPVACLPPLSPVGDAPDVVEG